MHKTVSITIGGALFHVEETAYRKLDSYLDAVRSHFASYPDAEEIVSDIEDRIAEELSETLSTKKKVILQKDVDEVIASMGTVEDFKQFEQSAGTEAPPKFHRTQAAHAPLSQRR